MSFNEYLKMAQEALKTMQLTAFCQTCGIQFIDIRGEDYVAQSSHFKDGSPDKWFVETGIHWVENDGHLIMVEIENAGKVVHSESISQIWENKLSLDQSRNPAASKEFQKPHFYKYRVLCKDKPI